jgi:hypothetical protein
MPVDKAMHDKAWHGIDNARRIIGIHCPLGAL